MSVPSSGSHVHFSCVMMKYSESVRHPGWVSCCSSGL